MQVKKKLILICSNFKRNPLFVKYSIIHVNLFYIQDDVKVGGIRFPLFRDFP